ncbi:Replication factor C subunit 4 [Armadillidium vulgare]|nr:Replication factor C subunit 4 [Armadillidium vulgare]
MELNASDERGIQVIREKVKNFAQTSVSSTKPNGQPCPPYKIIILDEADSMTSAAQAALRRTMEKQSKTTRFCLLCNYVSRIIDPLTSRCSKFRFKPLNDEVLLKHLSYICSEEGVDCEEETLLCLIKSCEGDLRKAITSLQSASRLKAKDKILKEEIYEITGVVPANLIDELFEVCQTDSYDKLSEFVESFIVNGYSAVKSFVLLSQY